MALRTLGDEFWICDSASADLSVRIFPYRVIAERDGCWAAGGAGCHAGGGASRKAMTHPTVTAFGGDVVFVE